MTADELAKKLRSDGHIVSLAGNTDTSGAAAAIGTSERTLKRWRADPDRPPRCIFVRGRALYPIADLADLITQGDCSD